MRVADLPDLAIPAGSAEAFAGFAPGMDMMKAMAAMMRARVHVNVVGRAVVAGRGELGIGLTPLEHTEASAGTVAKLAIDPPIVPPLRARGGIAVERGNPSHLFRPLRDDTQLVAMIALDTRAALAATARTVIDSVRDVIADDDKVSSAIFFAEPGKRPKTGNGKPKSLLRGKRFDALLEAVERESMVTLEAGPFAMSAGTTVLPRREAERVPWLTLSITCEGRDTDAIRARWTAIIDDAIRSGTALQAMLARAGWRAHQTLGTAPYETACALAHEVGTLRRWIERRVRVPSSDRLWITNTLAARIDRTRAEAIADVEPIGDAVRFTLRDRANWFEFEEAIAPLLATAAESLTFASEEPV